MENKLDLAHLVEESETIDVRKLREDAGMNRREFCEYFKIPYRTLQSWEVGDRDTPFYVKRLLAYVIRINGMIEGNKLIPRETIAQEGEEHGENDE